MYCAATEADCPLVSQKEKLAKMAAKKQCGPNETSCQLDVAPMPTGTAALTTSTVLPPPLTVPLLPRSSVDPMRPLALLDVAPMPTGTAALTTSTVLPQLLTAPLLPRRRSS